MKRIVGLSFFTLLLLLLSGVIYQILSQEMTHLHWAIPFVVLFWIFLMGIWYLIFGNAPGKTRLLRFGGGIALFVILGVLGGILLRYDGSSSGSSYPKFRWVWEAPGKTSGSSVDRLVAGSISGTSPEVVEAAGSSLDFLGSGRDGMQKDLPYNPDWKAHPPEFLWKKPVGKAWSGFAVQDGKAITQEQVEDSERVVCLNLFTGDELWNHEDKGIRLLDVKEENAGARMGGDGPRSTPVIANGRVFALGSTGILNCLELETGREIWEVNTLALHGGEIQKWGMANAPLLLEEENTVIIPGSDREGVTLAAYSQVDGSLAWTYQGKGASYSSPRILSIHGVRQIVSINGKSVTGHDPATGKRLWIEDWPGSFPKVAQPILVGENQILATASYGVGSLLLDLSRSGSEWKVTRLWKTNRLKTKFSSPVIREGLAYGIDEGRLAAIDLKTGDKVWKNQKVGFGQQLLLGDHLLIQTENGPVLTGSVDKTGFVETGRIEPLNSMTWNVPTLAGRILLIRNDQEAACYLLPPPE